MLDNDAVKRLAWAGMLAGVDLRDDLEHHAPALEEDGVEDLVLGVEVVVDEAVGDLRLVGHVGDPAAVEALPGEDPHGGVEDEPPLVDRGAVARGRAHAGARSGHA